jgi:hypothetical protein
VRKLRSYALAVQAALAAPRRSQHIPVKARPMVGSVGAPFRRQAGKPWGLTVAEGGDLIGQVDVENLSFAMARWVEQREPRAESLQPGFGSLPLDAKMAPDLMPSSERPHRESGLLKHRTFPVISYLVANV